MVPLHKTFSMKVLLIALIETSNFEFLKLLRERKMMSMSF